MMAHIDEVSCEKQLSVKELGLKMNSIDEVRQDISYMLEHDGDVLSEGELAANKEMYDVINRMYEKTVTLYDVATRCQTCIKNIKDE